MQCMQNQSCVNGLYYFVCCSFLKLLDKLSNFHGVILCLKQGRELNNGQRSADYNVYSTFQSHEPEFDYLKSLEIEEKINKIRWLKQCNSAHFLLSTNGNFWFVITELYVYVFYSVFQKLFIFSHCS